MSEAAVRQLLAAYCHSVDDGRFDEFAQLWSDDAVVSVLDRTYQGRDAIRAWIEEAMPPERRGKHLTLNTVITSQSESRLETVSDFVFLARTDDGGWRPSVTGRYGDAFELRDSLWSFASRTITLA